jgi:hypothetical protein
MIIVLSAVKNDMGIIKTRAAIHLSKVLWKNYGAYQNNSIQKIKNKGDTRKWQF